MAGGLAHCSPVFPTAASRWGLDRTDPTSRAADITVSLPEVAHCPV